MDKVPKQFTRLRFYLASLFLLCFTAGIFVVCPSAHAAEDYYTTDCLQLLSEMSPEYISENYISLDGMNITDEQYEVIKSFTLDLTKNEAKLSDKIRKIYDWVSSRKPYTGGPDCPDNLLVNDPYHMFKNFQGVCQGFANLCRTMLTAIDVPCIIAHGMVNMGTSWGAHAWNYVYYDGTWGIMDGALYKYNVGSADLSLFQEYNTYFLESPLYIEGDFEYGFYYGFGITGYLGHDDVMQIPTQYKGKNIVSVNDRDEFSEHPIYLSTAKKLVLPATIEKGILKEYDIMSFTSENLAEIEVAPENPLFASYKGLLYTKDFSQILTIPKAITDIELKPFKIITKETLTDMPNVRTLRFAEGTEEIEAYALEHWTSLEYVYIPDSVTRIDSQAILDCSSFTVYASENSAGAAYAKQNGHTVLPHEALNAADYTDVDAALSEIPKDLSGYTEASVLRLQNAVQAVDRECNALQQEQVDAMAAAIRSAISQLEKKPAPVDPDKKDDTDSPQKPSENTGNNGGNTGTPAPVQPSDFEKAVPIVSAKHTKANCLNLSWTTVEYADDYHIYYSESPNGPFKYKKMPGNINSFTLKKLKSGKTYYFKVQAAMYKDGKTLTSQIGTCSRKVFGNPGKPRLKGSVKNNKLTLKWKKQADVKKYIIYRKGTRGGFKKIKTVSGKKKSCVLSVKSLKSGTYRYRVKALRSKDGIRMWSKASNVFVLKR